MAVSLAQLARDGRIRGRDLDVVMVAMGALSYESIAQYLAWRDEKSSPAGVDGSPLPLSVVARELVTRLCGCQYQDGGGTELLSAQDDEVDVRVTGPCVRCPKIRYTVGVLESALRFRTPSLRTLHVDGLCLEDGPEVPSDSQVTLSGLMQLTGLRFEDLDALLQKRTAITDEDINRIAKRQYLRKTFAGP